MGRRSIRLWTCVLGCLLAGVAVEARAQELMVTGVRFDGNDAIDDYTLGISIATSQSSWFRKLGLPFGTRRVFDELEFRRDVLRIQLLYRQNGYYEARVDTVVRRRARKVDVRFRITEGPPIVVDTVAVVGMRTEVGMRRLMNRIPLRSGKPFNRLLFDLSADTIRSALRDRGFAFADVFRNYSIDRTSRLAEVTYDVEPGPRMWIGQIEIEGSSGVDHDVVRRFLGFHEGDRFSQSALYSSQRSLYRSDLFRFASVGIDRDSIVAGSDSLVRIRVQVSDAPRTRLRAGAGYGTIDCFRTQGTATFTNFVGGARRLDLAGKVSKIGTGTPFDGGLNSSLCPALRGDVFSDTLNYSLSATLVQPALFTRHATGSLAGFAERRSEIKAYENISIGGAASLAIGEIGRLPTRITYRLARSRTNADPATFCISFDRCDQSTVDILRRDRRQGTLSVSVSHSRVDSPIEPSEGRVISLEGTVAARALYSQVVFSKAVTEGALYLPVARRWVLAMRVRGGILHAGRFIVDDTTVAGDSLITFAPPEERFYAGGASTVRGYGRNEMGPVVFVTTDSSRVTRGPGSTIVSCTRCRTSPLGSGAITLGNIELRTPSPVFSNRLRLAAFVDAGQLWEQTDLNGLVPAGLRVTPGVGFRLITPLGPMRLDVGYNPYAPHCGPVYFAEPGQSLTRMGDLCPPRQTKFLRRLHWHFSVGEPF